MRRTGTPSAVTAGRSRNAAQPACCSERVSRRERIALLHLGLRPQNELPLVGVQHRLVARLGGVQHPPRPAQSGKPQGARQNGGVPGGAALLDHHARDAAAVPCQQLGRAKPAGDEDCARAKRPAAVLGR